MAALWDHLHSHLVKVMPHLLLIADLRHASPRWPSLAGALLQRGWEVTVITAPLGEDAAERYGFPTVFAARARIIQVGPSDDLLQSLRQLLWRLGLRRGQSLLGQLQTLMPTQGSRSTVQQLLRHLDAAIGWPDLYARWVKPATLAALRVVLNGSIDVMVSSSPYPSAHLTASNVKREVPQLRWVADFRDLWVGNHNDPGVWWRRGVNRWWERRIVRVADAFIAPTEEWATELSTRYGNAATVVPNGYVDYEQLLRHPEIANPDAPFTLLYSGAIYGPHQQIEPVCRALSFLKQQGVIDSSSFRLVLLGRYDATVARFAADLQIMDIIEQRPQVSRDKARATQLRANALLFLQWNSADSTNIVSSLKLHEYVASGRPILAVGGSPNSAVSKLLTQTGRAGLCFDAATVAEWVLNSVDLWRRGEPTPLCEDWQEQARQLSGISRGVPALERALRGDGSQGIPTHTRSK